MPWLRSSANKVQINVFCCCLIVNYGVAWHRTCYSIVCIIPWYPATRLQPLQFSQLALYFTVTGIPFCFSELLISFACGLWVWNVRFTGTFIPPPVLRRQERHNGLTECHCLWKYVMKRGPRTKPQSWRSNGQARIFHSYLSTKQVYAVFEVLGQKVPRENIGRNLMIGRKQQHWCTAPQGRRRETRYEGNIRRCVSTGQGRGWLIVRRHVGKRCWCRWR